MKALITDHLISKQRGEIYLDYLRYDLPQDEGDGSDTITFRKYLANTIAKNWRVFRESIILCNTP